MQQLCRQIKDILPRPLRLRVLMIPHATSPCLDVAKPRPCGFIGRRANAVYVELALGHRDPRTLHKQPDAR